MYELHIDHLLSRKISNKNYYGIVSCTVYFHCASEREVNEFCGGVEHIELIGYDSLIAPKFDSLLSRHRLNKQSLYFDDALYTSFKRCLQPPLHAMLHGIEPAGLWAVHRRQVASAGGSRQPHAAAAPTGEEQSDQANPGLPLVRFLLSCFLSGGVRLILRAGLPGQACRSRPFLCAAAGAGTTLRLACTPLGSTSRRCSGTSRSASGTRCGS